MGGGGMKEWIRRYRHQVRLRAKEGTGRTRSAMKPSDKIEMPSALVLKKISLLQFNLNNIYYRNGMD